MLRLNGVLDLALSRSAMQALKNGVPVTLQAELVVNRKRRYLADQGVGHLVQRWQIQYHALSEHYLVNNLNSGQQASYSSLAAALSALSEVRGLPVLDEALIERTPALRGVAAAVGQYRRRLAGRAAGADVLGSTGTAPPSGTHGRCGRDSARFRLLRPAQRRYRPARRRARAQPHPRLLVSTSRRARRARRRRLAGAAGQHCPGRAPVRPAAGGSAARQHRPASSCSPA